MKAEYNTGGWTAGMVHAVRPQDIGNDNCDKWRNHLLPYVPPPVHVKIT